jgi:hypothetical protein
MSTRGYNKCLQFGTPLVPNVYLPNQCYGQSSQNDYIESIAQARLVQRLDNAWTPDEVISRGIQWEASIGGAGLASMTGLSSSALLAKLKLMDYFSDRSKLPAMRVDVLMVGPAPQSPSTNPVGIIELKDDRNGGAAAAAAQAAGYEGALRGMVEGGGAEHDRVRRHLPGRLPLSQPPDL